MLKINKWLAILCASASAVSAISAHNWFFSSDTAGQKKHEMIEKEPSNKTCELENADVDDIILNPFMPYDPPPPPFSVPLKKYEVDSEDGSITWPLMKENIDIHLKKSKNLQIENSINNKNKTNNNSAKINIPDITNSNPKISGYDLNPQSKDFVSYMNSRFTISGKNLRKNRVESIVNRIEFLNGSEKKSPEQNIKDFSQQFNGLIPDSTTKDFITMVGGNSFQKYSITNAVSTSIISESGAKKSNYQKVLEISEQFNALANDLPQDNISDNININTLKKQILKEDDSSNSQKDEGKTNDQKIKELKDQLSGLAKTSAQKYDQHRKDTCKNTNRDSSASGDCEALKHPNYSIDDNSSSNSVFNVDTANVNINDI